MHDFAHDPREYAGEVESARGSEAHECCAMVR